MVDAAKTILSNRPLFEGDMVAGAMHAMILWEFLTLLIATTILGIDMDLYRPLTGDSRVSAVRVCDRFVKRRFASRFHLVCPLGQCCHN